MKKSDLLRLKRKLRSLKNNHFVQSFAYAGIPLVTFFLGWTLATIIILPIFLSPLIMTFAEWSLIRQHPYRMFNHKAGMGVFIVIIVPFSILWWILAPILLFE
jgi:hypothetical protein